MRLFIIKEMLFCAGAKVSQKYNDIFKFEILINVIVKCKQIFFLKFIAYK